jgi:hypothetical protein
MRVLPVTNLPIQLSADSGFTPFGDPYSAVVTSSSGALFTAPGTALVNTDRVMVTGTVVPTGFAAGTTYFVVSASGDTFKLSATSGGSAIAYTDAGTAVVVHILSEDVVDITIPFKADYTVVVANTTSGSLVLQQSDDASTWTTLATVAAGAFVEVLLGGDWIRVSTSATLYLLGN